MAPSGWRACYYVAGPPTRWKGQTIFIEAIKELGLKDVQCLIMGSDQGRHSYRRELERFIESHGMTGNVHVIGHCDDMPRYMLADIVVRPPWNRKPSAGGGGGTGNGSANHCVRSWWRP